MSFLFRRLAAGSIAVLLCFASNPARACSVCGCDPAALTVGLDRPSSGSLRVAVEDRYLTKESGDGLAAEGERENRLMLRTQFSPARLFVVQLELPFFLWRDHRDNTGALDDTARGLGDAQISARYELIRAGGFVPRHVLSFVGGIKLPTGANNRLGGTDEHKQLGSGSWDPLAGLWYTFGDQPWIAYAGTMVRINGENGRGFRYGNAITGTAGVRRAFLEQRIFLSLEGQARYAGYDSARSATVPGARENDPDSGGFLGYATGGVAVAIGMDLLTRVQLQVPVISRLHGVQSEHPVGFAGLSWDFAL
jgi:hypothetical protein